HLVSIDRRSAGGSNGGGGRYPGYNLGVSYNLGYSRGVNNSNHDWESSNHDIHAFNYDCPSTPSKDFCNGYIDGYGDGVHDILG
ncbi:MAG TPA: hypothetical protein VK553_12015, partial [Candidatus Nitrosopolaris rasttigaisensis]|nr:hypothetical protein [Candidatus Nitrosopolaris rasttigaisensis]